jgi:hypothetical protein
MHSHQDRQVKPVNLVLLNWVVMVMVVVPLGWWAIYVLLRGPTVLLAVLLRWGPAHVMLLPSPVLLLETVKPALRLPTLILWVMVVVMVGWPLWVLLTTAKALRRGAVAAKHTRLATVPLLWTAPILLWWYIVLLLGRAPVLLLLLVATTIVLLLGWRTPIVLLITCPAPTATVLLSLASHATGDETSVCMGCAASQTWVLCLADRR